VLTVPVTLGGDALVTVRAESASIAKANPAQPELRAWIPGEKAVRGGQLVVINLVGPGLNVDDDELAVVFRPHMREDITIVDFVAAPRELLSGITGLSRYGSHASSIRHLHAPHPLSPIGVNLTSRVIADWILCAASCPSLPRPLSPTALPTAGREGRLKKNTNYCFCSLPPLPEGWA
jgi:hypothetical protein